MSKFVVKKRISLDFLGEGWSEAYITFSPFSFNDNLELLKFRKEVIKVNAESEDKDIKALSDKMIKLLQDKFIEGRGFDGKELVDIKKEDFGDLPQEVFEKVVGQLQGESLSPKS